MSIATVVLRGFGTSSYADINKLPTLGYSSAAIAVTSGGFYRPAGTESAPVYAGAVESASTYRGSVESADTYRGKNDERVQ